MPKPSYIIDHGTIADLDELAAMEQAIFDPSIAIKRRQWRYHLSKNPLATVLVIRSGGQIVADAVMFRRHDRSGQTVRIYSLAVAEDQRGKGLGRKLFEECVRAAKKTGVRSAALEVSVENELAIKLYESVGFVKTALMKDFYEPGDAWKMWIAF